MIGNINSIIQTDLEDYQRDFFATYVKFMQDSELFDLLCGRYKSTQSAIAKMRYFLLQLL